FVVQHHSRLTGKMPVPQSVSFVVQHHSRLTGKMPVPQSVSFVVQHHSRLTGKMPVPQSVSFVVGWASCPPIKGLNSQYFGLIKNAQDLHPGGTY
ncbi:MAG: hypothetical protein QQW96_12210, partial [Tychonema bourrellyi B0820]|nr:hypothetical protein [Tychonema bourrellyi B0820]